MVRNLPLGPGCRYWIVKKRGSPKWTPPFLSRSVDLLSLMERWSLDDKIQPSCLPEKSPSSSMPSPRIGDGGDFRVHEAAKVESAVMNFNTARPVVTNVRLLRFFLHDQRAGRVGPLV